jgi:predicted nuclease of predicted toxin-antitoxin system
LGKIHLGGDLFRVNFLIDENVPINIIPFLTKKGYKCITLQQLKKRGILNGAVVQIAIKSQAILITCDTDFLNLKKELQIPARIVFIYVHPRDPIKIESLLKLNISRCIEELLNPGVMKLTLEEVLYISPEELIKQRRKNSLE